MASHHRVWPTATGLTAAKDAVRLLNIDETRESSRIRLLDEQQQQCAAAACANSAAEAEPHRSSSTAAVVVAASALVTMEELVEWTVRRHLLPKVVAEFPGITVGGAIAGGGVESSSGKFGLFSDAVAWIAVHLPPEEAEPTSVEGSTDSAGRVVKVAKRGDELWGKLCCTFGAPRCLVLEAGVECVALRSRSVQLSYYSFRTAERACEALVRASFEASNDFVDGLQLPREYGWDGTCCAIAMVGRVLDCDRASMTSCSSHGWKRPKVGGSFFFEHVLDLVQQHLVTVRNIHQPDETPVAMETLDIVDYLFRYDAGAFWMARPMAFEWKRIASYVPFTLAMFVASHRWMRYLTGWVFSSSRRLYRMLQCAPASAVASKLVLQDLYVPPAQAPRLLCHIRDSIPLSVPLWLCPVRTNDNQPFSPSYNPDDTVHRSGSRTVVINCGVYGRLPDGRGREHTQRLEEVCAALGGRKMLYGHCFYSRASFETVYGSSAVARALYDKTCTDSVPSTPPATSWAERMTSWIL